MTSRNIKVLALFANDAAALVLILILHVLGVGVPLLPLTFLLVALILLDAVTVPLFLGDLRRKPSTGKESLIGEVGKVVLPLNPEGYVKVRGELWRAVSPTNLNVGDKVVVVDVRGSKLVVSAWKKQKSYEEDVT